MTFNPETFIASEQWTFAKTMPQNPHEYVVRRNCASKEDFDDFVRVIRQGERRVWGGKIYLYYRANDGKLYWTMGWPAWYEGAPGNGYTYIINRVFPEDDQSEGYDPDVHGDLPYSSPDGLFPHP